LHTDIRNITAKVALLEAKNSSSPRQGAVQ
jgi:hypothetical protein